MSGYQERGLIPDRYCVSRGDDKPVDPEAKFFVLRYDKNDEWCRACRGALRDFASRIRETYPKLSDELHAEIVRYEK